MYYGKEEYKCNTYPALKVHLCTERHQRLDAFHLSDAVITLLNQLEENMQICHHLHSAGNLQLSLMHRCTV